MKNATLGAVVRKNSIRALFDVKASSYLRPSLPRKTRRPTESSSQSYCPCAILTPHVTIPSRRGPFTKFILSVRHRCDGRWASLPSSGHPLTLNP